MIKLGEIREKYVSYYRKAEISDTGYINLHCYIVASNNGERLL